MCRMMSRLAVAVGTFILGIALAMLWFSNRHHERQYEIVVATPEPHFLVVEPQIPIDESPEQRAVRSAEEFIQVDGYTDAAPDRNHLSYETVEFAESIDKLLEERQNTLESRAYGIRYGGRMGTKGGWTVVFRYKKRAVDTPKAKVKGLGVDWSLFEKTGRAVTMDADFGNLRVEHKGFWLDKVDKKL